MKITYYVYASTIKIIIIYVYGLNRTRLKQIYNYESNGLKINNEFFVFLGIIVIRSRCSYTVCLRI